jgi:hypothetical protein
MQGVCTLYYFLNSLLSSYGEVKSGTVGQNKEKNGNNIPGTVRLRVLVSTHVWGSCCQSCNLQLGTVTADRWWILYICHRSGLLHCTSIILEQNLTPKC